jgi:hypothetical protein
MLRDLLSGSLFPREFPIINTICSSFALYVEGNCRSSSSSSATTPITTTTTIATATTTPLTTTTSTTTDEENAEKMNESKLQSLSTDNLK